VSPVLCSYENPLHISAGTYGTVVSTRDAITGRTCAIKKMFDPWRTPLHGKRTFRELRLLRYMHDAWPTAEPRAAEDDDDAPFQHQQIVALLDVFVASTAPGEESLYLVMEHGGIDLSTVYKQSDVCRYLLGLGFASSLFSARRSDGLVSQCS
jgi:serine/threonine protein kinase